MKRTLYVIGVGVKVPDHVTLAASEALGKAERVYSIVQQPPDSWMPRTRAATEPVINLMPRYVEGAMRADNYARVAQEILGGFADCACVAYVTYGNPLSFDSVAQMLVRDAPGVGARVEVVPGISSIDTILCDLRVDMAPGVQVYEASWLVATETPLNVGVAAILLQLGHFGSVRAHYRERRSVAYLAGLVTYLTRFYPESHAVHLVQSSDGADSVVVRRIRVVDLTGVSEKDRAESLYIPALRAPTLDLDSVARLAEIH